ncbi:MAG: hypothetical protein ACXAC7_19500 [Candidatus Hodarchaeales archaeon]
MNPIGVSMDDTFNFKVVENDLNPSAFGIDMNALSFNWSAIGLENFDFAVVDSVTNKIVIPGVGDILVIKITGLPTVDLTDIAELTTINNTDEIINKLVSNFGNMTITLYNVTQELPSAFLIGTPVALMVWDLWTDALNNLEFLNIGTSLFTINVDVDNSNALYFNSTIEVDFTVPSELSAAISSMSLTQTMSYEKSTGIQEHMLVSLTVSTPLLGETTQKFHMIRTTEEPSQTSESSSTHGFEIISLIIAGIILIQIKRKH